MDRMEQLRALPGTRQEEAWLRERMETLSVREGIVLDAAMMKEPPRCKADAINHLFSLHIYDVLCMVGSYEGLGEIYLQETSGLPKGALPFLNKGKLGELYENAHPGLFIGNCFVAYPREPPAPVYDGNGTVIPNDGGWGIKVKLASSAVPGGVWLRLPCFDHEMPGESVEVVLALQELEAESLEDCTLLDTRCIFPEIGDLMDQYNNAKELVGDAAYFGYVLEERGQGEPHWMEKLAAALEYEHCHTLCFALDISQNLPCYEWIPCGSIRETAEQNLKSSGVTEELIHSGCIDLEGYGTELLASAGYVPTSDGSAYITRNSREFVYEYSAPPCGTIQMT